VDGQIPKPAAGHTDFEIWNFNNKYAQCLITQSVAKAQMMYIGWLTMSHEMWTALKAIHEPKGHQTAIAVQCALFATVTEEGNDIAKHLVKLKKQWEQLYQLGVEDFMIRTSNSKGSSPLLYHSHETPILNHMSDDAKEKQTMTRRNP